MSPEKQRIAILESIGWTELKRINFNALRGTSPEGEEKRVAPNPLTNLNVMHKIIKSLSAEDQVSFAHQLYHILGMHDHVEIEAINADIEPRAEALLKTLRKWEY